MLASPAAAATAAPLSSWIGPCHLWSDTETAGGWCDGNGPNWDYQAVSNCANQVNPIGPQRWAGDRRGSYGCCSEVNSQLSYGYMYVTYNGMVICDFYIAPRSGTFTTATC